MFADLITMSSYYVDSAQERNHMFADLTGRQVAAAPRQQQLHGPGVPPADHVQEGAIFYNTTVLRDEGLPVPQSLADLADRSTPGRSR